jgi:hypothetical protein
VMSREGEGTMLRIWSERPVPPQFVPMLDGVCR